MPVPKVLFLATIALAGVLLFRELGLEGIAVDEATSTVVEVEMLRDGHWFSPTFRGEPEVRKPPLSMWMSATSLILLGDSEFALRFPAASLGLGTVALVFWWAARLGGAVAAVTASLALVTVPEFLFDHCARTAVQDSPLIFFTTAAALAYVYGPPTLLGGAAAGLLAGLALLSKGVAAFALLAVVAAYELVTSRGRGVVRARPWIFALVAFGVAAVWFVPEWWIARSHVQAELAKDLGGRIFHGGLFRRWPLHFLKLRNNLGLWLVAVPVGAAVLARRGDPRGWLAPLWAAIVLFIFTAAGAKYPWYPLPAYPAIAVLVGVGVAAPFDWPSIGRRRLAAAAAIALVVVLFLPAYARAWQRSGEVRWQHSKLRAFEAWASATLPPEAPVVLFAEGINHSLAGHETFYGWKLRRRLRVVASAESLCAALESAPSGAFAIVSEPLLPSAKCLADFSASLRLSRLVHASKAYIPKRIIPFRAPVPPFFRPAAVVLDASSGLGFISGWSAALDEDGRRRITRRIAAAAIDVPDLDGARLSLHGRWTISDENCGFDLRWNGASIGKLPASGPDASFLLSAEQLLGRNLLEIVHACPLEQPGVDIAIERIVVRAVDEAGFDPIDARITSQQFIIGARQGGTEIDDSDAPGGRAVVYGAHPQDTPAFVFFVPVRLPAGHYQASFWIRGRGIDRGLPAVILDVWADEGRRRFARRDVRLGEIVTASGYRRVDLEFWLDEEETVQPRVEARGGGAEVRVGGVSVQASHGPANDAPWQGPS